MYFGYSSRDNLPLTVKFGANSAYVVENNYDELTRLRFKTYTLGSSTAKINTSYSYLDWTNDKGTSDKIRTTGTVRGIDYTYVAEGLTTHDRWYTYDNVGNILTEKVWTSDDTKPLREKYTYDSKNQLVRHDSVTQNCTITYAYDAGGNITTKKTYAYTTGSLDGKTPTETINYTYGNSAWKDELTSYNGESIVYDAIGNPTLYRGWGMTWQGRQLTKAVKDKTVTFTYDSEGIRTSKSDGTNTTKYLLNGTQILAQKTGSTTLSFFYDQQGNRVGMADSSNHFYYYIYNLQGDVIALADASTGKLVVTYTYDAWGKLMELKDTTANSVGTQNPFRYRGYYYDAETGLYYLQSRYYNPEVGRFINADCQLNTDILGHNMFAYCDNNPVMRSDPAGNWSIKNAIKKFFGWISSSIKYEVETKKYTSVEPKLYGYSAKGEISSVSAGKEKGAAVYAGFSKSTGNIKSSGVDASFGLTYTSNNLGATVSIGADRSFNFSLDYNGTAYSFSQGASGGTFTVAQTVPNPAGVGQTGMFSETRINKTAEYVMVGSAAVIVYYAPAIMPEIVYVAERAIGSLPMPSYG